MTADSADGRKKPGNEIPDRSDEHPNQQEDDASRLFRPRWKGAGPGKIPGDQEVGSPDVEDDPRQ